MFLERRWLTLLGIFCLIGSITMALISINGNFSGLYFLFGSLLSVIIIGLGEILAHLKKGDNKNENNDDEKKQ